MKGINFSLNFYRPVLWMALFYILGMAITTNTTIANAQGSADAKRLLDKMSEKYRAYKSLKASYTLTIVNKDQGVNTRETGSLIMKGEKYNLESPDFNRICDGKIVWTHFKDQAEVQINRYNANSGDLSPAQLFTAYKKGYKYAINGTEKGKDGKTYTTIDLTSDNKDLPFFKIRFLINSTTNVLQKAIIFNKNGQHITYELANIQTNTAVGETTFMFDTNAYPDVEVIDLR
ncbi:MAG: outer membrane lipoprotein carrier protein LolA [Sphingobacteriales bacterium]|nr:outer membrane lipoprotein carrier protein LolA [Sphingobacteriales bacterium]